jgi:quinoprotein glucose dehydrogenase
MKIAGTLLRVIYGLIVTAIGGALAWNGWTLLSLGGSAYYLPVGIVVLLAGFLVLPGGWKPAGWLWFLLLLATVPWAIDEAGFDGWALMPRLISPLVLGLPFLVAALWKGNWRQRTAAGVTLLVAVGLSIVVAQKSAYEPANALDRAAPSVAADAPGDWLHFGNDAGGRFHSPLGAIGKGNVGTLQVAWQAPLGPMPTTPVGQVQTVPIMAGGMLYACDSFSNVFAFEPESGKQVWRFDARQDLAGTFSSKCRGVTYYAVPDSEGTCAARIYTAASMGELIALDAATGAPCEGFGANGRVSLMDGLKARGPGYYRITSAPTLVRGKLVVGSAVTDGQHVGEPSGVVRAYDAVTGRLAWAWDVGNPANARGPAGPEKGYTPGTPNVWGPMSADEELGMVYVPTGNATPDYWAGHRTAQSNEYGSSVVALDAETGEPRWHFQTTHYDVWDYDVASQPVLFDLAKTDGSAIPALLQPTKRGELFVLDRRTGEALFPIVEQDAPQDGAVEKLSPTQPWSTAMPHLMGPQLDEESMWGVTALDQLLCRVRFRQARYDGPLTPPGDTWWITYPGYTGGVNWGSAAIDTDRQMAFILSNRLANYNRLVSREDPSVTDVKPDPSKNPGGLVAQDGTPYVADIGFFFSQIGVPCQEPPHGLINAVDLRTGRLAWSRPIGTARDSGPMRIASRLPFTIGTMTFGGTMSTASGLVFAGGSQDHAFRAFDAETGEILFEADLPGSTATRPMTYRSEKDGRQYVVVSSQAPPRDGGAWGAITAFALPEE